MDTPERLPAEEQEAAMEAAAEANPPGFGEVGTLDLEAMSDEELRQTGDDLGLDFTGYTRTEMIAVLRSDPVPVDSITTRGLL